MLGQLRAVDAVLGRSLERYEQAVLDEMRPFSLDPEELRRRGRQSPYVAQYYVLDDQGQLLFPPVGTAVGVTDSERESLRRTSQIWDSGVLAGPGRAAEGSGDAAVTQQRPVLPSSFQFPRQGPASSAAETPGQPQSRDGPARDAPASTGWHVWYWGDGIQMMLWARDGQRTHAAEINRARLIADLIADLPETDVLASRIGRGPDPACRLRRPRALSVGLFRRRRRRTTGCHACGGRAARGLELAISCTCERVRISRRGRILAQFSGGARCARCGGRRPELLLLSRAIARDERSSPTPSALSTRCPMN